MGLVRRIRSIAFNREASAVIAEITIYLLGLFFPHEWLEYLLAIFCFLGEIAHFLKFSSAAQSAEPNRLRLVLPFGGGANPQPATIFGLIRFRNSWMLAIVSEMDSCFGLTLPSCRSFRTHTACSSSIHISMSSCLVSIWKA